jgi:hypothetical protein
MAVRPPYIATTVFLQARPRGTGDVVTQLLMFWSQHCNNSWYAETALSSDEQLQHLGTA